ncbi:MAG: hypothetical protein JW874_14800 [Spirochaetales bacterium]|nr:hypothetical protein [Spirochaetales bacterium]
MAVRNAIFMEEHNFTFGNRKSRGNFLLFMLLFAVFGYMSSPINGTIYYIKNNIPPYSGAFTAISALLILLVYTIRRGTLLLEDRSVTKLNDWICRSPLKPVQIILSYLLSYIWHSIVLVLAMLPVLIMSYSISGAGMGETAVCTGYLFLAVFLFQLVCLLVRGLSENQGAFIALWIVALFVLVMLFALLGNTNPFSTIIAIFSTDRKTYPNLSVSGHTFPYYFQGLFMLLLLLAVIIPVIFLQIRFKQKNKRSI